MLYACLHELQIENSGVSELEMERQFCRLTCLQDFVKACEDEHDIQADADTRTLLQAIASGNTLI